MKNIDASYIIIIFQSFLTSDFLTPVNIFIRIYAKKTFFFFFQISTRSRKLHPYCFKRQKHRKSEHHRQVFISAIFFFFLFIYLHTAKSRNKIGRRILSNFFYFSNNFERNRLIKFDFAIELYPKSLA